MAEAVHELHLPQHVGLVTGLCVHLQSHHLPSDPVLNLRYTDTHTAKYNYYKQLCRKITSDLSDFYKSHVFVECIMEGITSIT